MDKNEIIKTIINFIKPKYYNRITWIIVLAGLGLTSTNIIELIILKLFEIELNLQITKDDDPWIGVILIVIALTYNYFMNLQANQVSNLYSSKEEIDKREHDKIIYNKINRIISEEKMNDMLKWIKSDHSYTLSMMNNFDQYLSTASEEGNKYLSPSINKKKDALLSEIHSHVRQL